MTEKNIYRLVNPYIEGTLDTMVKSSNSARAGKKIYNVLSPFITNHMENFYFTIQNVQTKGLTHFLVNENKTDERAVGFKLTRMKEKFTSDLDKKLIESVDKMVQQSGGKKHKKDKDDSTTDTTTDAGPPYNYMVPMFPINRFVYFMLPYYKLNVVGLDPIDRARLFMPMFSFPVNPIYEIRYDLYNYSTTAFW